MFEEWNLSLVNQKNPPPYFLVSSPSAKNPFVKSPAVKQEHLPPPQEPGFQGRSVLRYIPDPCVGTSVRGGVDSLVLPTSPPNLSLLYCEWSSEVLLCDGRIPCNIHPVIVGLGSAKWSAWEGYWKIRVMVNIILKSTDERWEFWVQQVKNNHNSQKVVQSISNRS